MACENPSVAGFLTIRPHCWYSGKGQHQGDADMTTETMSLVVEQHKIVNRLIPRFGNEAEAWNWLNRTPLPGHGCATAHDLIREGRTQEVLAYIDSVDAGVHA
jgi:uncharacterized protein (DUF2384 family)